MLTIDFPDKSVTYDTFVRDVASSVVRMLADTHNDPEMVSQRKAYAMFGRGNVDRWRKQGKITPASVRAKLNTAQSNCVHYKGYNKTISNDKGG